MVLFKKAKDLKNWIGRHMATGTKTGFVPTMGALHEGHLSLIKTAKNENELTVCSIFINPKQFNDLSDFNNYPVTIENDIRKLEQSGCDVLFLPTIEEMYPPDNSVNLHYELGNLESILEGKFRPGHFQGVCIIVDKLLQIVSPNTLYLGQKDYQQCMVIAKLLELTDKKQITISYCPTLRETDGLAMSSRNSRLTIEARGKATAIFQSLQYLKTNFADRELEFVKNEARKILTENGFKIDYVEIVEAETLSSIENWDGHTKIVALIAAFLDDVRLIDNLKLN